MSEEGHKDIEKKEKKKKENYNIAAGLKTGQSVNETVRMLDQEYAKPSNYTGNRRLYDSPQAKIKAKEQAFFNNAPVKDPYTGNHLLKRKQEAKAQYGNKWSDHLAESDHTKPIKDVYQTYKDDPWITNHNIKDAVNSDENIKVISRKVNNAKRSRTNEDFVDDKAYLKEKGIHINRKGQEKARQEGLQAEQSIAARINANKMNNGIKEFHEAGMRGAYSAATMTATISLIDNFMDVVKGKKTSREALQAIVVDTGTSVACAYLASGTMSVVAHSLSNSASPFIKALVSANVPGKIVSAVMATGNILLSFMQGDISTSELIIGLGESGVGAVVSTYSMVVGSVLIPIPFVGAAVGAMVGVAISGSLWNGLKQAINRADLAREEYEQVQAATDMAIKRLNREREQFEIATEKIFAERAKAINAGFEQFCIASRDNDFDLMVGGLDKIANSFGKDIQIHDFKEFDDMMNDDTITFDL